MKFTIFLDDDLTIFVDNVDSIVFEEDELILKGNAGEILAVVSKNDYKAIVQE